MYSKSLVSYINQNRARHELLVRANISWKKTQKINLKCDKELVKKSGKKLTRFYQKTRQA